MMPRHPRSTLFPYTTLFRSQLMLNGFNSRIRARTLSGAHASLASMRTSDRKSTRLNSSHANISYAVFCLKKKKKKRDEHRRVEDQMAQRQALSISTDGQ